MSPSLAVDPSARAASVGRHPSSSRATRPGECPSCGFRSPPRHALASAVEAVPDRWAAVLGADPADELLDAAARVRDELHVIANRIGRVLAAPGAAVVAAVASIEAPAAGPRSPDHLVVLQRLAARRLADLLASLGAADWELCGRVGARSVTVAELAVVPLHRSHARLATGATCERGAGVGPSPQASTSS